MKFQKTRVLGLQIADFFEYIFFLYCTRCYVSLHVIGLKNKKHSFLVLWLKKSCKVSVVQSLHFVQLFGTSWTIALQASLSFTVSWSLLKLMFTESVMPSKYLILCRPFSSCLQSFPASASFLIELALHIRWPKYWSLSFSPSNEYSGLISFRIDWFDLLAVQGTV